MAYLSNST